MADWFSGGNAIDSVSISDRGFQYGDGLFETVAIRGGAPRLWQYHVDRLGKGCRRLGIKVPSEPELSGGVLHALQNSDVPAAYSIVKIILSSGPGRRGYGRAFAASPSLLVRAFAASPPALDLYKNGIDTVLCETRLASGSATAGLKTLNRLEQVLARSEFVGQDVFEGLTMDTDDNIICGTMSNVFFVLDETISTPSLDSCGVEGVMRRHIIETLKEQGINTEFRPLAAADLKNIDEIFLANSQFGILPVKTCMNRQWAVGPVTRNVMSILADNGVYECRQ